MTDEGAGDLVLADPEALPTSELVQLSDMIRGWRLVGFEITIQFGGSNGQAGNCLAIVAGWNYDLPLYRPRAEILSGT